MCRVYPQKLSIWETGIFGNFSVGGGEFCHFKTGIPGGPGSEGAVAPFAPHWLRHWASHMHAAMFASTGFVDDALRHTVPSVNGPLFQLVNAVFWFCVMSGNVET